MDRVVELLIKVISNNHLHGVTKKGKVYKKKEAREFEDDVKKLLRIHCNRMRLPESGDLEMVTRVFVSRKFDTSNCLKLFEDCVAKHFGINDRRFAGHRISRVKVKEGEEKLRFLILPYEDKIYDI